MTTSRGESSHYEVLGLSRSDLRILSDDDINKRVRKAFREKSRSIHPDHQDTEQSHPEVGAMMARLGEARDALIDKTRRQAYDQSLDSRAVLSSRPRNGANQTPARSTDPMADLVATLFNDVFGSRGGGAGLFGSNRSSPAPTQPRRGGLLRFNFKDGTVVEIDPNTYKGAEKVKEYIARKYFSRFKDGITLLARLINPNDINGEKSAIALIRAGLTPSDSEAFASLVDGIDPNSSYARDVIEAMINKKLLLQNPAAVVALIMKINPSDISGHINANMLIAAGLVINNQEALEALLVRLDPNSSYGCRVFETLVNKKPFDGKPELVTFIAEKINPNDLYGSKCAIDLINSPLLSDNPSARLALFISVNPNASYGQRVVMSMINNGLICAEKPKVVEFIAGKINRDDIFGNKVVDALISKGLVDNNLRVIKPQTTKSQATPAPARHR